MSEENLKKWISQVRKGTIELCILGLIENREIYAFELIQELEQVDGLVITEGTIYPLLKRLQGEELITSFWCESDSGPPRKYYRITEKGSEFLKLMKTEWFQFTGFINNILERGNKNDNSRLNSTEKNRQIHMEIGKKP